jgi:hypothetical protein
MVTKEVRFVNVMDVYWDGWFNSFKMFQSIQNGVEQKSLQAFESQKNWIQTTRDQLSQLEEDSKKLPTKWKTNLQDVLNKGQNEFDRQNILEWANRFEELGIKAETLAFSPYKAYFELLLKSHAQLETTLKEALDQQQKNRAEVLNAIASYVNLLKQAQNVVLKSFEIYNPLIEK